LLLITMPRGRSSGSSKSVGQRAEIKREYAHPLPIAFTNLPLYPRLALGALGLSNFVIDHPTCIGTLDTDTQSVWVTDAKDINLLWKRGFFGKGNLSRSEPTWFARQQGSNRAAELITAQRRNARQQFKQDRARAIIEANEKAEAAFVAGEKADASDFLIAPKRPSEKVSIAPSAPGTQDHEENPPVEENLEHLQLTFQEAFFLSWSLSCLSIFEGDNASPLPKELLWQTLQTLSVPSLSPQRPDNPFIINYVVYHHFRSLGWVIRGGLKFCVDYLLYKKGPVFSHAEFALVVCPTYEDPEDQDDAPYNVSNSQPFSWSWLSTLNRVNTQVQKSLILVYVTIPSRRVATPEVLRSPECLDLYTVREVTIRRFIPARMRD